MLVEETRQKLWDEGWKAYFDGKGQKACIESNEQEERDAWMDGWLTAQSADTADLDPTYIPPTDQTG